MWIINLLTHYIDREYCFFSNNYGVSNMNHVRNEIGHQLLDALHQCNLADITSDQDYSDRENDINPKCSRQHEAYGHISEALTSLGFNKAREVYVREGDIGPAHSAIDNNPRTRKSRLEEEVIANRMAGNGQSHELGGAL